MKVVQHAATVAFAIGCVLALSGNVSAQARGTPKIDAGQREYVTNCANCHGQEGKGNGPYAAWLRKSPPDLTRLALSNGGVFPIARVFESIEGSVAAHGGRDMPIWGQVYRVEAAEYWQELPYNPESVVRARILSLIDYLYRIQARQDKQ